MIFECKSKLSILRQRLTCLRASCLRVVICVLVCVLCTTPAQSSDKDADLWKALSSGGHIALLRHAIAPGTGDPPDFKLGNCKTQRNLSTKGRDQATKIGELFRGHGIQSAQVFSSQWCRCLETARLLGLGPVQELPFLNSFFNDYEQREPQTKMLKDWINKQSLAEPIVLVTHQVNITALTNVYPSSGELVIVRRSKAGELTVIGTIETD